MYKPKFFACLLPLAAVAILAGCQSETVAENKTFEARRVSTQGEIASDADATASNEDNNAILGGGCFWCVEADFEKLAGVTDVVSGYSSGTTEDPTYENYANGGHIEVVKVTYDPTKVNYAGLIEWLIKHSDPTDPDGSFGDRGKEYSPVIQYENERQKSVAQEVIDAVNKLNVYDKELAIALVSEKKFWPAEDYHQNYAKESLVKYDFYRYKSGRDAFIEKHWGKRANKLELPQSEVKGTENTADTSASARAAPWENFEKPSEAQLRKQLTEMQYGVTQKDGTEPAFDNKHWDNKQAGIYVDIVSGEPLFLSTDKYRSGTGWPSFVQPLDAKFIELREDNTLLTTRTEVRSKIADSHVGHVFNDGPSDRGGKRWCMNSAAMRFISKTEMEAKGYGKYVSQTDPPLAVRQ